MNTLSFSLIFDSLFSLFIGFIISFVIMLYFLPYNSAIIFSVCFAVIFSIIAIRFMLRKRNKGMSKKDKRLMNSTIGYLNISSDENILSLFEKAYKNANVKVERKGRYLFLSEKNIRPFFYFSFEKLTKTDIVKIYNLLKENQTAEIYSESFSAEVSLFASRFGNRIKLLDSTQTFLFLKENNALPSPDDCIFIKDTKHNFFDMLINKKRAKTYFSFGIILLFSSFFVYLKTYYIVFGCLLLILSFISRLYGKDLT